MALSHVASKMLSCHVSNLINTPRCVPYINCVLMSLSSVSHVDFKKRPNAEFRGRGPLDYFEGSTFMENFPVTACGRSR